MQFRKLIFLIKSDVRFYGGKSLPKIMLTFFFKHSFLIMLNYRLGHYFLARHSSLFNFIVVYLKYRQLKYGSCHISYEATIGQHLNLPHPVGIVIGKGVVINNDVTLYQNCTLGQKREGEYPVLYDHCTIYPGSVIVGNITIGERAIIGANSFVNRSVATNETYFSKK